MKNMNDLWTKMNQWQNWKAQWYKIWEYIKVGSLKYVNKIIFNFFYSFRQVLKSDMDWFCILIIKEISYETTY